ncbi:hypothetical protein SADUNF_Sadunf06G0185600 [Salix dunnii]|uniref:Uncharacterized protein n=1 Tax=Salix dunnii TaxID=1413687 RepID=A0A835N386_9ROSI|nr:hypothetical protein SADUNF_Sadunf06G0185600 [Salix dunnii]
MEKDSLRSNNNGSTSNTTTHSSAQRTSLDPNGQTTSSDFVLQWGNRKRLRCMKVQVKDVSTALVHKTTVRVDRRVVRDDNKDTSDHQPRTPPPPPPPQRILSGDGCSRNGLGHTSLVPLTFKPPPGLTGAVMTNVGRRMNSENSSVMRGGQSKVGGLRRIASPDKEKEEDFFAFKGSKLPQRPKKRAKFIQRSLNLVSPGAWLCDLTLERYEVREKKITKKRPRGLKAMGSKKNAGSSRTV